MKVNQQAIADLLDLDRTTVTKILNRDPKYSASDATKERVFRAAELLGYDFTTIRRPFKREYGRSDINSPCEVTLTLEDGTVFDSGRAVVRNLSVGGALISNIRTARQVLPLQNFTMLLEFPDESDEAPSFDSLQGLVGECEIVRLAGSTEDGEPELGVRFINATHRDRRRIQEFVDELARTRGNAAPDVESIGAGQLASGSVGARLNAGQLPSGSAGTRVNAGQLPSGSAGARVNAGQLPSGSAGAQVNAGQLPSGSAGARVNAGRK